MPRLYHTKSRTGCARCRARRVKCDESRPKCKSCDRHGVDCVYDRPAKSNGPSTPKIQRDTSFGRTSQTAGSPGSESSHLMIGESRDRRYREMRLLHYFTVKVTRTFPGYFLPEVRTVWTEDVPVLAMEYEPLLNAIMALSIQHMVFMDTSSGILQPNQLASQGAKYLEATLQEHRRAIGSLDRTIADPASFTSVILALYAFANLRERTFEPYIPPVPWLQMCKGVMNVFKITMAFVRDDPTAKINVVNQSSSAFVEPSVIFCEAHRNRFPYLLISQPRESDTEEDQEAYSSTACLIGALLTAQEGGEPSVTTWRKVVIFPILFPMRFVDLLSLRRPRALVILAHYFGVASKFDNVWWVGDSPRREVLAIAEYLGSDWQYQMAWPMEAIRQTNTPSGLAATIQ